MSNVMSLEASLTLDTSKYDSSLVGAEGKAKGFGTSLVNGLKTAAGVAVKAVGAAGAAVGAFAAASVKVGAGFDSAMSQVAATFGYSAAELNDKTSEAAQNFEMLRDYAQEMGASTAFSASQAADAMNILAMAGYDASQVIDTLPDVLNMAAAGGLSIAEAADYATGIIAGFSNETLDAGTIADKLATIASSAKGDVKSFGEALSTVAGMANTTGQSMHDMTVALGILGNNNYSASEAGNALSRTLKNLYQPTDTAMDGLIELGVSAYDAEGKARPLQDVLVDLSNALDGMSDAKKNAVLSKIFDAATLKSVPALLNNATTSWNELDAALQNSAGAAEAMASVQLDNLEGDITLFKSALEGAQIQISDALMPTVRGFVQEATGALSSLTTFVQNGGLQEGLDALKNAFGRIWEALKPLVDEIKKLATDENTAKDASSGLSGALDLVVTVLKTASKILAAAIDGFVSFVGALNSGIFAADLLKAIIIGVVAAFTAYHTVMAVVETWTKLVELAQLALNAALMANPIALVIAAIAALVAAFIYLWNTNEEFRQFWINLWEALKKAAKTTVDAVVNFFKKDLPNAFNSAVNFLRELPTKALQWGKDLIGNFIGGIKAKWEDLKGAVSGAAGLIQSHLHFSEPDEGPLKDFHTYAPDMMKLFAQGIKDNEHLVTDQIDRSFDFGSQIVGATPAVSGAPVTINVYGAEGQNEKDIAEEVMNRLRREYDRGRAVYA